MKLNTNIKKMVGIAALAALVVVMQFITSVIPPIGGFSISLVLIPIVVGAAMYGPGAGAFLGATFGVVVTINCMTGADVGGSMVFHANPMLCVAVVLGKGILAGLVSGLVYKALKGKNAYVAMLVAAILCPVVNTGVFVACMFAFFIDVLAQWAAGASLVGYVLTGLVLANFVPELLINVVFTPVSHRLLREVQRKQ